MTEQTTAVDRWQIIKDTVKLTVKLEDELIQHILFTMFSAYSPDPLNLGVMGLTSEGKTYPVLKCAELFPPEDLIILGGASPTSFLYQRGVLVDRHNNPIEEKLSQLNDEIDDCKDPKEKKMLEDKRRKMLGESKMWIDFTHKTVIFLEPPSPELWKQLKTLLSHDKQNIDFQVTDRSGKGLRTRKIVLHNWPATIFCSANTKQDQWDMWPEIQSRYVVVSPTSSAAKYKAGIEVDMRVRGRPPETTDWEMPPQQYEEAKKSVKHIKNNIISLIDRYKAERGKEPKSITWIPYYRQIAERYPAEIGARMREARQFRSYIILSCLVNLEKRCRLEFIRVQYPITNTGDLEVALTVFRTQMGLPPYKWDFYRDYVISCFHDNGRMLVNGTVEPVGLTARFITEYYNKKGHKSAGLDQIRKNFLDDLVLYGYLDVERDKVDRRKNIYYIDFEKSGLGRVFELADFFSLESLKEAWNDLGKSGLLKFEIKDRHDVPISLEDLYQLYFSTESESVIQSPNHAQNVKSSDGESAVGKSRHLQGDQGVGDPNIAISGESGSEFSGSNQPPIGETSPDKIRNESSGAVFLGDNQVQTESNNSEKIRSGKGRSGNAQKLERWVEAAKAFKDSPQDGRQDALFLLSSRLPDVSMEEVDHILNILTNSGVLAEKDGRYTYNDKP